MTIRKEYAKIKERKSREFHEKTIKKTRTVGRMNIFNNRQNGVTNVGTNDIEYNQCLSKYATARCNLLSVFGFTMLNIVLAILNANIYMLFSAQIPYAFAYTGYLDAAELGDKSYLITGAIIAVAITLPYLLLWVFSKKHYACMIAAIVYFALDCIFLILNFNVDFIIDILFHILVMYYLIMGVKYGRILKKKYNFPNCMNEQKNANYSGIDESFMSGNDDDNNLNNN